MRFLLWSKIADYIIDLGPEGGDGGGKILFEGTPEGLAENKTSFTAGFLKEELQNYNRIKKGKA